MKKKKLWGLITILVVAACFLMGCSQDKKEDEVSLNVPDGAPTYEDDEYIELAAFCGPASAGNRTWGDQLSGHPDDPDEVWDSFFTEENIQDYLDAGFTYAISDSGVGYSADFDNCSLKAYMDMAEKMKLPMVVTGGQLNAMSANEDWRLSEDNKQILDNMIEDLSQYKMFKGFTLRDEPSVKFAKTYGSIHDYVWSKHPDFFFFTCMFPIYGQVTSFTTQLDAGKESAYKDYIRAIADATNTFAYDYYPLYIEPAANTTSVKLDYYLNYELVARDAKEHDYDAGIVVQSASWGSYGAEESTSHPRKTSAKADISYQVYSALAYGMKYINYYTYWEHRNQGPHNYFYDCMVMYPEKKGEKPIKTDTYYAVQAMNQELKKFDHVFLKYDWEGCLAVPAEGKDASALLSYVKEYESPRIKEVTSTEETLIGCLKDEQGYDGFFIVNATDPGKKISSSVTVTFREATSAVCYIEGEETTVELKDGSYTFDLKEGEGIFVIPVK